VRRVVAVGANYHYRALGPIDAFEVGGPSFDKWSRRYAKQSPDGIAHARVVVEKTLKMFATEPTLTVEDLASITAPVLVMAGDDEPIDLAHTCSMYEAIPDAQLCIVPGASHEVLRERPRESGRIIGHFLRSQLPPKTYIPSRRKPDDD
jgi:pimeloyl-ACP methyl ester carboxylesterase